VDACGREDTVIVTNGVYGSGGIVPHGQDFTNRVVIATDIVVRSVNGPTNTFIVGASDNGTNGPLAARCVWISDGLLTGFTITNGYTQTEGAWEMYQRGGGVLLFEGGTVSNCIVRGCSANITGGGVDFHYGGVVVDCTIEGNTVNDRGAGVSLHDGALLDRCIVRDNSAGGDGSEGGGGLLFYSGGTARNCLIANNTADNSGGGIYVREGAADSVIENCTIVSNTGEYGGGVYAYGGTNVNCIVYDNTSTIGANQNWSYGGSTTSAYIHCCTVPLPTENTTGCITNDPQFADASSGDYRLKAVSLCIDAGHNGSVLGSSDLDGNARIANGTVDMGAYENTAPTVTTTLPTAITTNSAQCGGNVMDEGGASVTARGCAWNTNGSPIVADNHTVDGSGTGEFASSLTGLISRTTYFVRAYATNIGGVGYGEERVFTTGPAMAPPGSAFTIEYWFRGTQLQSPVRLQDGSGYVVAGWGGSGPQHIISTDGGTGNGISCGNEATIEDGNWHHLAMTWQSNTVNGFKSYLDGVIVAQRNSSASSLPLLSSATPYLGCYKGSSEFLAGHLDEVRIWNVARTAAELRDHMHRELTGNESNLLAYYPFNQQNTTALDDVTTNDHDGTLVNGPVWTNSTIPCAATITNRVNLRGAWLGRTNSLACSILSVSNTVVSGGDFRVFGHDAGALTNDTPDKPGHFAWRLNRAWQVEGAGPLSGDIVFDCSSITGLIANTADIRLLKDDDGTFANAASVAGTYTDDLYVVGGQSLEDGFYYTLGEWGAGFWVITASAGEHGSIDPAGAVQVVQGGTTNFVITPEAHWHVDNVTTNGASVGAVTGYTWSNVTADGTIHAEFAADLATGGTPHWWMALHGLTNGGWTFNQAETNNPDLDPFTSGDEYTCDTDPNNPTSYFCISNVSMSSPVTVYFESSSNRYYTMNGCSNLMDAAWTNVPGAGPRDGVGGADEMNDTNQPPKGPFYRLEVELLP